MRGSNASSNRNNASGDRSSPVWGGPEHKSVYESQDNMNFTNENNYNGHVSNSGKNEINNAENGTTFKMTTSNYKKDNDQSNNVFSFERESESVQNNQAVRQSSTHAR